MVQVIQPQHPLLRQRCNMITGAIDLLGLLATIAATVLPVVLAHLKEKHNVRQSSFDLGLDQLHAADERMQLEDNQHQTSAVQSGRDSGVAGQTQSNKS